jgi:ribosomal protein S18 acetylase RimI-like enzyme
MHTTFSIELVQAKGEDIEYLLNLRKDTMGEHYRNAKIIQTSENIREKVLYRFDCAKIVIINGEKAGLVKIIKNRNEWELCQIQLSKKYQRKGIGNSIILGIIQDAKRENSHIRLHVLKGNPAKKLYERLGFKVSQEGEHSYEMRIL